METYKVQNRKRTSTRWIVKYLLFAKIFKSSEEAKKMSSLDFFLLFTLPNQLEDVCLMKTRLMKEKDNIPLVSSKMIKFIGACDLITRFEFPFRRSLCNHEASSKYTTLKRVDMTGMNRKIHDSTFYSLECSYYPRQRPLSMLVSKFRKKLLDDFVNWFNDHAVANFNLGSRIFINSLMIKWHSYGGDCINYELIHYVNIEFKPENGLEMKNSDCEDNGISMQLLVAKGVTGEAKVNNRILHSTKILFEVFLPWVNYNLVARTYSCFDTITAAELLHVSGFEFIGTVKRSTKK